MTADQGDRFNLDDRDRLPWLEPAEEIYENDSPSAGKIIGLVLLSLALIAAIIGGLSWLKNRDTAPGGADVPVISAQSPAYKVPANAASGRSFEGEGDSAYPASEGAEPAGQIDSSKVPEAPLPNVSRGSMTREQADAADGAPAAVPDGARQASAPVKPAPAPKAAPKSGSPAPAPVSASPPAETLAGPMIQLGAYGSEKGAKDAWTKLARRFDYLAPLVNAVSPVTTASGGTLYRLRASAASAAQASELCGRLRVAGEECRVVN